MISWSSSVGLRINQRKCMHLWIPKRHNIDPPCIPDVSRTEEIKILGVHFSSDLKWIRQMNYINRNASRRLYALRILRPIMDRQDLVRVYCGLIRCILEYCSPLMVGMLGRDASILDRIQRRAHRLICGESCDDCDFFPDLRSRRTSAAVKLLNAAKNPTHPLHDLYPAVSSSGRLILPHVSTSRRRNSFFPFTTILINSIFVD